MLIYGEQWEDLDEHNLKEEGSALGTVSRDRVKSEACWVSSLSLSVTHCFRYWIKTAAR